ncbi:hypothetical protein ABXJ56_15570 [Microbacterium chocolatum]|uniref:hypothetical protein n=1 Tax=Microbacterium aurantiacum TaxID=162393 RepID=UPI00338F5286
MSLVLCWLMYLTPLNTAHCTDSCDYAALSLAVNAFFGLALAALVASGGGVVLLRNRGWWVLAPPMVAIVIVSGGFAVATQVAYFAMRF